MSNDARPRVVDKTVCEQLLQWLGENTPGKCAPYKSLLYILHAFATYAKPDHACTLSYAQYLQYCHDHQLAQLARWGPATLRKEMSHLSTLLLSPACHRLGRSKSISVTCQMRSRNDFIARLGWTRYRSKFLQVARELKPQNLGDANWIQQVVKTLAAAQHRHRFAGTEPVILDECSPGRRSTLLVPLHSEKTAAQPSAQLANRSKYNTSIVSVPIRAQKYELTQLSCLITRPDRLTDDMFDRLLQPYQAICAQTVRHYRGYLLSSLDGRITALFGYPERSELHARTAVRAALQMLQSLERIKQDRQTTSLRTAFRILLHTFTAVVKPSPDAHTAPSILGAEARAVLGQLEELDHQDMVLASESTRRRVKGFFDSDPVYVRKPTHPDRRTIAAYQILRENKIQTAFDPSSTHEVPLIGRTSELKVLQSAWEHAKQGRPRVVWVSGMRGIGKSRVIHEFVSQVMKEHPRILLCQCWSNQVCTPFYPLVEMLKLELELEPGISATRIEEKIRFLAKQFALEGEEIFSVLRPLLGGPKEELSYEDGALPGEHSFQLAEASAYRERAPQTLHQVLRGLANKRPVILLAKDVHWADPSSRELLAHVLDRIAATPGPQQILVVVSFRGTRLIHPRRTERMEESLRLTQLTEGSSRELAEAIVSQTRRSFTKKQIDAIVKEGEGIPHVIWEKTTEGGSCSSWFNKITAEGELEQDQENPIITRQYIAQVASILGRKCTRSDLQIAVFRTLGISSEHQELFDEQLNSLLQTELLSVKSLANRTMYQFACESIRDCFYGSMSTSDQERLHIRIAEVFEEQFVAGKLESAEVVARHYSNAAALVSTIDTLVAKERFKKAILWWHRTAKIAMNRLALQEALDSLENAQKLTAKCGRTDEMIAIKLRILLDMVTVNELLRGPSAREVHRAYKSAKRLATQTAEIPLLFRTQWQSWLFTYVQGNLTAAKEIAKGLLRMPAYKEMTVLQLEAHHAMWDTLFHLGQLDRVWPHHFRGLVISRDLPSDEAKRGYAGHAANVCCLSRGALSLWGAGSIDQSSDTSEEAVQLADSLGHPNSQAQAHCQAAILSILRRDPERIQLHAEQALSFAEQHKVRPRLVLSRILLSIGQLQKQPHKQIIEQLEQHLTEWRGLGIRLFETLWFGMVAEAWLTIGDREKGLEAVNRALRAAQDTQELFYEPELHRVNGELLLATTNKHREKAFDQFRQAVNMARQLHNRPLELRALVSLNRFLENRRRNAKERREALRMLDEICAWFNEGGETPDTLEAKTLLGSR